MKHFSALYEAALSPTLLDTAVRDVGRWLSAGVTILMSLRENAAEGHVWMHRVDPACYTTAPAHLMSPEGNAGIRYALKTPGTMIDRRAFMSDEAMETHPVSRQFFRPNGIRHLQIGLVQADSEAMTLFVTSRTRDRAFDGACARRVAAAAEHAGRAMRTFRALRLGEARGVAFSAALDRLSHGVMLIDRDLRIHHASTVAEAMLETGDGIERRSARLQLTDPRAQTALEAGARRLGDRVAALTESRFAAERPEGGRPLAVTLLPALGEAVAGLAPRGRILVLVAHPNAARALDPEALVALYALTATEARIAVLAAAATSVDEIAARLGVSRNTVKTHLKWVYLKTGVRSQAELVRYLSGLIA